MSHNQYIEGHYYKFENGAFRGEWVWFLGVIYCHHRKKECNLFHPVSEAAAMKGHSHIIKK